MTLRGVNAGGRSKFAPYMPWDPDDEATRDAYLDLARSWGIDVLRMPFSWNALEPRPGEIDQAWLDRYEQFIDAAWQRGMWTIIDFHQDVYAEVFCGDGFPNWTVQTDRVPSHACENWFTGYLFDDDVAGAFEAFWADTGGVQTSFAGMWDLMAGRFADHPGVIGYEVINEPNQGNLDPVLWATTVLTPFYTTMAARLNAVDPDALVLFDATGIDSVRAAYDLRRPDGHNLVFAPHFYAPTIFLDTDAPLTLDVEGGLQKVADVGVDWDLPVLIGEFGADPDHPNAVDLIRRHYESFDTHGMHGTIWEYSRSQALWNFEDFSIADANGHERPTVDAMARPYVRALAGTDAALTVDAETGDFSLVWAAEPGGITEIALPSRTHAAVQVRGSAQCQLVADGRLYVIGSGSTSIQVTPQTD